RRRPADAGGGQAGLQLSRPFGCTARGRLLAEKAPLALEARARGTVQTMQVVANIVFLSTFYASFSIGLALVFGVMRVINYAHGELYMIGGYALWLTLALFGHGLPGGLILLVALLAGAILVGLLGAALEMSIFRPLKDRPFSIFLATLG